MFSPGKRTASLRLPSKPDCSIEEFIRKQPVFSHKQMNFDSCKQTCSIKPEAQTYGRISV